MRPSATSAAAGAGGPQLVPQLLDLGVPAERPGAVGQHGMLLGAAGLGAERLELALGLGPAPEPVQREPVQLADRRGPGRLLGQGAQQAAGLLVPLAPERVGGVLQARLEAGDAVRADRVAQVVTLGAGVRRVGRMPHRGPCGGTSARRRRVRAGGWATGCARPRRRPRRAAHPRRSTPRAPRAPRHRFPVPRPAVGSPPRVGGAALERTVGPSPRQATPAPGSGELVGAPCAAPVAPPASAPPDGRRRRDVDRPLVLGSPPAPTVRAPAPHVEPRSAGPLRAARSILPLGLVPPATAAGRDSVTADPRPRGGRCRSGAPRRQAGPALAACAAAP